MKKFEIELSDEQRESLAQNLASIARAGGSYMEAESMGYSAVSSLLDKLGCSYELKTDDDFEYIPTVDGKEVEW